MRGGRTRLAGAALTPAGTPGTGVRRRPARGGPVPVAGCRMPVAPACQRSREPDAARRAAVVTGGRGGGWAVTRGAETAARRQLLQRWLHDQGADAALVTSPASLRYLSGWHSRHALERLVALLLPVRGEAALLVPALEAEAARSSGLHVEAWRDDRDPFRALASLAGHLGAGTSRWAVEKGHLTLSMAERLTEALGGGVELLDAGPALAEMRLRKSPGEVAALERAAAVLGPALEQVRAAIRPGITERHLAARVREALVDAGADDVSFEPIVLSGPQSAFPHGHPSRRAVEPGDVVLVDCGAVVDGYCSDITRTFAAGRFPQEAAEVYDVVLAALEAGIAAIRPGALPGEVDAAARRVIEDAGYGPHFTHRVGHGLGLEIHEGPWLHAGYTRPLEPGMVVTVEPGIYLPGRFGVRIEEMVLVTEDGRRVLTRWTRERSAMEVGGP